MRCPHRRSCRSTSTGRVRSSNATRRWARSGTGPPSAVSKSCAAARTSTTSGSSIPTNGAGATRATGVTRPPSQATDLGGFGGEPGEPRRAGRRGDACRSRSPAPRRRPHGRSRTQPLRSAEPQLARQPRDHAAARRRARPAAADRAPAGRRRRRRPQPLRARAAATPVAHARPHTDDGLRQRRRCARGGAADRTRARTRARQTRAGRRAVPARDAV